MIFATLIIFDLHLQTFKEGSQICKINKNYFLFFKHLNFRANSMTMNFK